MKTPACGLPKKNPRAHSGTAGLRWLIIPTLLVALAGSWLTWQHTTRRASPTETAVPPAVVLSDASLKILAGLETEIELRFFAPTDASILPTTLSEFVTRVENLLTEYKRVSAGKVRVSKCDPQFDVEAKTAAGNAGIIPFATDTGEIVYLGLTVGNDKRRESITPLAPEWEAALESDLSRAIARLSTAATPPASPSGQAASQPATIDPVLSEELLHAFPNLAEWSFADAAKVLREETLEKFKTALNDSQVKVLAAQQALAAAQNKKNAAEIAARQEELQQARMEQTRALTALTTRLQERIAVLQQLKTAPNLP